MKTDLSFERLGKSVAVQSGQDKLRGARLSLGPSVTSLSGLSSRIFRNIAIRVYLDWRLI
jgi:hypothetical protein